MARVKAALARRYCSLCNREITADRATHTFTIGTRDAGRYCGPECRDGMQAVDEIRELQQADEIADALLAL
jgi:hypothetical protein